MQILFKTVQQKRQSCKVKKEKDIVVNKLLDEITKMREEQKIKEEEQKEINGEKSELTNEQNSKNRIQR